MDVATALDVVAAAVDIHTTDAKSTALSSVRCRCCEHSSNGAVG